MSRPQNLDIRPQNFPHAYSGRNGVHNGEPDNMNQLKFRRWYVSYLPEPFEVKANPIYTLYNNKHHLLVFDKLWKKYIEMEITIT